METAERLAESLLATTTAPRVLVAIAGIPGSGKTTLAGHVAAALSARGQSVVVLPMDGFHFTRAQLDAMEDPVEAHRNRGAPFTFDALSLVQFVHSLHTQTTPRTAPSFNHALHDPTPNDILIPPSTRFVILEGIYMHLSLAPWNEMQFDVRWFVCCAEDVAMERLARRHFEAGVEKTIEEARGRARGSDAANARIVLENRVACDEEIWN
ncbi:hypothetical protein HDU98_010771 [Podochytrium sp. JEL0797]|nr:hypothetical protein HDU98_010771 [Podochytrium sp. JEL0797]